MVCSYTLNMVSLIVASGLEESQLEEVVLRANEMLPKLIFPRI